MTTFLFGLTCSWLESHDAGWKTPQEAFMEPISKLIYRIYEGTPQHDEWVAACLEGSWPAILGEVLSGVCRPGRFSSGRLTVLVCDPTWLATLQEVQGEFREKIRTATSGVVREIHLRSEE